MAVCSRFFPSVEMTKMAVIQSSLSDGREFFAVHRGNPRPFL